MRTCIVENKPRKTRHFCATSFALILMSACGGDARSGSANSDAGPSTLPDAGDDSEPSEVTEIQQGTTLALADGMVRGATTDATRTFIGIPYAAPPVGDLRWKPPAAVAHWDGVLDATGPGVACIQGTLGRDSTIESREDCLQINVFAPDPAPRTALPVMVWLHGGGNVAGSANDLAASQRIFDGAALIRAAAEPVVVVTLNYRLGALGFLAHPALRKEQGASGNYGLMDQQAALHWVKRNILAFGGDPKDVTLFGESAGAMDTCFQILAHGSEGLFQRAIMESGSCATPIKTAAEAESDGNAYAATLGCPGSSAETLTCLRAISAADAQPADPPSAPGGILFMSPNRAIPLTEGSGDRGVLATLDGRFLAEQPRAALEAGHFADVPMIIGTNAREAGFLLRDTDAFTSESEYLKALSDVFGDQAHAIAEHYPVANYASANDAANAAASDFAFVCPARSLARAAARETDVFVYNWSRGAEVPPFAGLGAAHGVELLWVWDIWTRVLGAPPDEVGLVHKVADYWTVSPSTATRMAAADRRGRSTTTRRRRSSFSTSRSARQTDLGSRAATFGMRSPPEPTLDEGSEPRA
jgi:para-nitrobenzyl esterase